MRQLVHDVGIDQYSTVRNAYEKAKALLTQENPDRKELSGLLNVLEANKEGIEWLKLEFQHEYQETFSIILRETRKERHAGSWELISAINTHIGRTEEGLYYMSVTDKSVSWNDNKLMGMLYGLVGDIESAKKLDRLIPDEGSGGPESGIFYVLKGKYSAHMLKIGTGQGAYMPERFGSLYYECGCSLIEGLFLSDNADLCLQNILTGKKDNAEIIMRDIERLMPKGINGLFPRSQYQNKFTTHDNALMAIAYALLDGAKLCALPKREK